MSDFAEFDAICEDWRRSHPDEDIPCGELFGQWLADTTGAAIIGGPISEAPIFVALPNDDMRKGKT